MEHRLAYKKFFFRLTFQEEGRISAFLNSTIRGGFGYSLKYVTCINPENECDNCLVRSGCVYSYVFDTPRPKDSQIMRLYDTVPHPFIMYIPAAFRNGKRPKIVSKPPFDEVEVELTLFGKSIGFLPYFIYTFARLGEKGLGKDRVAFTLEEVRTLPEDCVIYNKGDSQISDNWKTDDLVITGNSVKYLKKRMRVILESPLRIQKEGRIIKKIELRPFFTTLLRRLFSLFYFHSGETLDWDYNHLADLSEKLKVIKDNTGVESLSRFSTRQKKSMRFDGISGDFVLEGKLGALYEILQAGTITHLGKTTSFGMGKYRLEEI